ncbi:hypothetical protein ACU8KH_03513 [Lachancea thermotolerans]
MIVRFSVYRDENNSPEHVIIVTGHEKTPRDTPRARDPPFAPHELLQNAGPRIHKNVVRSHNAFGQGRTRLFTAVAPRFIAPEAASNVFAPRLYPACSYFVTFHRAQVSALVFLIPRVFQPAVRSSAFLLPRTYGIVYNAVAAGAASRPSAALLGSSMV